jgi:hypothetical protein
MQTKKQESQITTGSRSTSTETNAWVDCLPSRFQEFLIAIQVLDGVANCIFVVVSVHVISDRKRCTGHFKLPVPSQP